MPIIIIGWFASALIAKLADKVRSYIGDQYVYQSTSDKEILKGLERNLWKIQASLHRVDPNEIRRNPAMEKWISDLQHASYDAEDVFDKFEYKLLKDQVRGKNQVCNILASSSRNLSKRAQTFIKQIMFLDGDLNELLAIAGRFADLVKDMGIFIQLVDVEREMIITNQSEEMEWRQTTSTLTESLVLGRERAIARIKEFLQEVEGDDKQNVSVLPIVGIGGVGKTTIAQYVYNEQTLTGHFDLKAWVCVSDRFEVKRLMKEMIESASLETTPDFYCLQNLDRIEKILQKGLKQKKFLLVLDDVWNEENMRKWEMLKNTLNLGKGGSKVIVTTRDRKVADRMKTTNSVPLDGLEYEDSWKLFVQNAFSDENPEDHPKLKSIGRQITKRLGGLPLAAKTIGCMLNFNFEEDFWRGILERKLWDGDHAVDIMRVLKLSYECLPAHLKQCFIYSSLFPKDYRFNKDALVRIWVAHGFIQPSRDKIKTMEELGRAYIDELVSRSLFEGKASDDDFVIHDLLHDLAVFLSSDEYFRVENFESDEEPEKIPERVRHLYIRAETLATVGDNNTYSYASKNLRSLVVSGPSDFELSRETLKELTGLRVLIFENLDLEWSPESISDLIHLRYLMFFNVRSNKLLPKSLCKLYHLQVLDLERNHILPKKINCLINLRRLVANADEISKIKGIGKITALQNLQIYKVSKESGHGIGQLKEMNQLSRVLTILDLENVVNKEEAADAMLHQKRLRTLALSWTTESIIAAEVLDGLRPHRNLKELKIRGYSGISSPSWLKEKSLSNLDLICLTYCKSWEVLPPFGQLPFLKSLELFNMESVKQIGRDFYGDGSTSAAFPSLQRLVFDRMSEWSEWLGVEEGGCRPFPKLSYLVIRDCYKLKGQLPLPHGLKNLDLQQSNVGLSGSSDSLVLRLNGNISIIAEWIPLQSLSSFKSIYLSCYETTSFSNNMEEWFRHLTSLHTLEFNDCDQLESLPSHLSQLSSLEVLLLKGCSNIKSLPEKGLPSSLRELTITGYFHPELYEWCIEDGPNWHKIAHITTIRFMQYGGAE